jgi:Nif-specific regulatory protein
MTGCLPFRGAAMNTEQSAVRDALIMGNRYQIERPLGINDIGDVYLCRDLIQGQMRVAVRTLGFVEAVSGVASRSSREFSLLQRLRHPNLARIMDFGILEGSGELFLVHEWIKGEDLYAGTEGSEPDEVLAVMIELLKAMQYLHARGIVHGNLKPSNVILSEGEEGNTRLKIMNYGLMHLSHMAQIRRGLGALAYTAPEILLGKSPDKRSDFYSLGILMYQILMRRLPFEDEDPGFLIQKHLQGSVDLRPIERMRSGSCLSQLVRSLLDKDPANRPSSGEEIIRLIGDALGRNCLEVDLKEVESHFTASQFVGRAREMSHLQECAARVRENGRGWTVFITGEAGLGKTRCMEELRSWALLEGWRVSEGVCGVREEGAYGPYRQILANTDSADGEAIFHFGDAPRPTLPGIFESSSHYATGQFRDLLARELVRRLSGRPTLLLLHDFHLADEATNAVLDYLSSDIQAHTILICVSLRSGDEIKGTIGRVMESAIRQERGEILALEPLTKESVEQLIEGMTGDSRMRSSLGTWVFKCFGGNPFFLEEILKHLVEQKILRREFSRWRFVEEELAKLEIPAGIGVVLQRRLAQLSSTALELANWLALFQGAVSTHLLASSMSQGASITAHALLELSQRQMIRTEKRGADEIVEFRHSLIAEVIRSSMQKRLRQKMHCRIAEALEREYGTESHIQELAMHSMEGFSGVNAVRYALAAATLSRAEFAHENALRCFEFIFKKRNGLTGEQLCKSAIETSDTMFALGLPKRSIRLLNAELKRNKAIEPELKARMLMQLALSYQHLGDLHMQEVCCKRGLAIFRNWPAGEINMTKAMLWAELAFAAILQSHPRRGLAFLEKARQACPVQNASALEGRIQIFLATLYRVECKLRDALTAGEEAATILRNSDESYLACSAYSTLGIILQALGRFPLALEKHALAISLSDKSRSVVLKSQALGNLAECLCRIGRNQEAVNVVERAAKSVCEASNPAISYAFHIIIAEIKTSTCSYRDACQIVSQLVRDSKNIQAIYTVGHAFYVAANLSYMLGDFKAALEHIEKVRNVGAREAPFIERELAEALRARISAELGSPQKALAHLYLLNNTVTKKHWPYHMCIIKLHICEILIKQRKLEAAERYATNALRLSKAMKAISLISYCHLLLGQIYSPIRHPESRIRDGLSNDIQMLRDKAVEELCQACQAVEYSHQTETAWRAHAELCSIFKILPSGDRCFGHAKKAYEILCKIEEQVPSEMLPAYCSAFERNRIKAELVRLIESEKDRERISGITVANIHEDEKARILLRMSATVNSIRDLSPLLDAILDQLIQAVNVERAFVFLKDELAGRLQLAKGRNGKQESLTGTEQVSQGILNEVLAQGRPILSANAQGDPRLLNRDKMDFFTSGKFLCAPLKLAGRVMGVLYADHSSPTGGLSESAISLFAAFCNIAAIAIDNSLAHQHLVKEKAELEQYLHQAREGYAEIIGKSASIELLRDRIGLAATSPLDVLITGESGSGKELVAKAIYRTGRRKNGKFIPVDCGSFSDSLAEAELFGFRKGAFTGASDNRQGLLEAAHEGIIFLDEISNLPFRLQAKLLRVLQEREVRRIGEIVPRKIDIQVIAATNKDLLEEMRHGRFREDLFYRLKSFEIRVPPLRDRPEDTPLMIEWFLKTAADQEGGRSKRFLPEALELLNKYMYPGNIRELKNIVMGAYYSTVKTIMGVEDLPPEVRCEYLAASGPDSKKAEEIYLRIREGKGSFESLVKRPFLQRLFGTSLVREVIRKALKDSGGKYRDAFLLLRIPERCYSATIQFLKHHHCYLDFRPFRRSSSKPTA